jgi:hypothetical protein
MCYLNFIEPRELLYHLKGSQMSKKVAAGKKHISLTFPQQVEITEVA